MFAQILDPYFNKEFTITRKTVSLSLVLSELAAHIYGQLARLYFDRADDYKTASIKEIYNQILKSQSKGDAKGVKHERDLIKLPDRDSLEFWT